MGTRTFKPGEISAELLELTKREADVPLHLSRSRATMRLAPDELLAQRQVAAEKDHITGNLPTMSSPSQIDAEFTPAQTQADLLTAGEIVDGKYQILRLLGSGGMGQVYEGRDVGLRRPVAIKVAWPHVGPDPLRREAQVLAALRHPGLVAAYALATHNGRDVLVMERLTGASLAEAIQRRTPAPDPNATLNLSGPIETTTAFSFDESCDLLLSIGSTLSLIHDSGLAHCDLKPANIILCVGRVVLLDFGIVRIEQLRGNDRLISGSPHYMAPEAIRAGVRPGEAHLVDLYSLGVIAYVLFAGEPPFDHADPVQLMMMHIDRPPMAPRLVNPAISDKLDRLILSMLAKEPEDRPSSIEEFTNELRSLRTATQVARAK